jgi:hypothetical protein
MSEEGNKNPRTMHKGSAKALPFTIAFESYGIELEQRWR